VRKYFDGESTILPEFYHQRIKKELGVFYNALPDGAIYHDHLAYLKAQPVVKLA
jgi:hypothetical protein